MGKTRAEITVIIPHCNGVEILRDCLQSLLQSTELAPHIIVVDNASTDDSVAMVTREFPAVQVLQLPENRGFAGGCNAGTRAVDSPYTLILNNDTLHEKGWLETCLQALRSDPNIAAVQPKIRSYQQPELFDYSGACGGEMDIFGFPFARGRIIEEIEPDRGQYDELPPQVFWASGTAFLARTSLLRAAGLFDETFFAHMEELDLQWRLQLMGYKTVVAPRAVIYHRSGYTLGAESPLKKYLNHRNSLLMLSANIGFPLICYLFPLRILLDYFAVLFSLIKGDLGRVAAILKAQAFLALHPGLIYRRRRGVKHLRRVRDRTIMARLYHGSVALAFYLGGKRRYSDL